MTLEQERAANAWSCSEGCDKDYVNLAKSLPALIMNSGLMQVLAYLNEKGCKSRGGPHYKLGCHLRHWLVIRSGMGEAANEAPEFKVFMQSLMKAEPREFQAITAEALNWLRWLRQIAPARFNGGK